MATRMSGSKSSGGRADTCSNNELGTAIFSRLYFRHYTPTRTQNTVASFVVVFTRNVDSVSVHVRFISPALHHIPLTTSPAYLAKCPDPSPPASTTNKAGPDNSEPDPTVRTNQSSRPTFFSPPLSGIGQTYPATYPSASPTCLRPSHTAADSARTGDFSSGQNVLS